MGKTETETERGRGIEASGVISTTFAGPLNRKRNLTVQGVNGEVRWSFYRRATVKFREIVNAECT